VPKQTKIQKLTELELEIMSAIWELGETAITEVHSRLGTKYAYTTIATMMKILEKKKYLKVFKRERAHQYLPLVSKEDYESTAIDHLVDRLFDGAPSRLVMKLLDASKIDPEELNEIRKIFEKRNKNV
jgi:predicted transcriptional regulator